MRSDHWRLAVVCALFVAVALGVTARVASAAEAEADEAVDIGAAAATSFRFTDVAKAQANVDDEQEQAEADSEDAEDEEESEEGEEVEAEAEAETDEEGDAEAEDVLSMLLEEDTETDADADLDSESEAVTVAATDSKAEQAELAEALTDADSDLMSEAEAAANVRSEVESQARAFAEAEELALAEQVAANLNVARSTYNEQLAREHVRYSSAAYFTKQNDNVATCLNYWGMSSVKVVKQWEMQPAPGSLDRVGAFVGIDNTKSRIIVAFRGTNSPQQLVTEAIQSTRVQLPDCAGGGDCWVMSYFLTATNKLCPVISPIVRSLVVANPSFKLHISGHSLGGALASLCAFFMRKDGVFADAIVYTFGMPRIGNKAWANRFSTWFPDAIRVTHHFDPVPRLPPCATTLFPLPRPGCNGDMGPLRYGYHFPGQVYYPNTPFNTYKICSGNEDETCVNSAGLNINIQDHLTYLDVNVGQGCSHLRK